jgi:phospholipid/cholesterol/gamma-HCH transport system substrate-binding protein
MRIFRRKKRDDLSRTDEGKRRISRQEIKIGLFIAMTMVILALFIFVVGDFSTLFRRKGYPLYAYFDSVAGLEKKTVVRMAGVKVGYVQDIRLKGNQAEVELNIGSSVKISRDSQATLASLGLLGEKYVEILPGEEDSMVVPGGSIGSIPPVSFDQLGVMLASIGEEIQSTSKTLKELLGDEDTRSNLRQTFHNLAAFSSELNDFFTKNKGSISQNLERSAQAIQDFNNNITDVSTEVDELVRLIKDAVEENRGSFQENLKRISELIDKIEESLTHLNNSLERINKGEGTLGKLIQEPELYEKTDKAVNQIQKMVTPVSSLHLDMDLRAEYFGESNLVRSTISLGFWPVQDKFVLGQLTHNPWEDKFTFSLQGGMRWGPLAPRAGILESEFGVGLDYYSLKDRLILTLEGFDFNRRPRPRVRASSSYAVSKVIFFLVGVEDFTLASHREFYFGIRLGF